MLWQIPQGHINGSLDGRDLPDTSAVGCAPDALCGFQDSATSYFFGDLHRHRWDVQPHERRPGR